MNKFIITIISIFIFSLSAKAQETKNLDSLYSSKVETLDALINNLYSVISGDSGVERDWDLFRYLFTEEAKLIPTQVDQKGNAKVFYLSPQDYVNRSGPWLIENGFHEVETHRVTDTFGFMTQIFSTYEAFKSKSDKEPFMTGINSIQVHHDGKRFWIVNIYWQQASDIHPIPEKYLKH